MGGRRRCILINANEDADGLIFAGGKPRVSSTDHMYDVAHGNIPDRRIAYKFGRSESLTTSESDVWMTGGLYVWPAAGMQMSLVSSSPNDDDGNTGIRTVIISYLKATTLIEATEIVTLDGTNPVLTVATDIYRVNGLMAGSAGSAGKAVGIISIKNAAGSVTYKTIPVGNTEDRDMIYTVPGGYTLYLDQISAGSSSITGKKCEWVGRVTCNPRTGTALTFFLPIYQEITQNITIIRTYRGPMKFIEKTDIKLSAISDTASTIGLAEVRGWLEKN